MTDYRPVESLPVYSVGTLQNLLERESAAAEQRARSGSCSVDSWNDCEVGDGGRYGYNAKGRILLVTKEKREIVVCTAPAPPPSSDRPCPVYAFDRNCYHVGYPMDLGDMEDITVCNKSDGNVFHVTCINCPLHNRIFDLKTGDLVTVSHFEGSDAAPYVVSEGRRKGGAPTTHGCHQRVHPVHLEPIIASPLGQTGDEVKRPARPRDYRILVRDTFGQSNALSELPAAASSTADKSSSPTSTTVMVETNVRLQSDKYNQANSHEDFAEYNPRRGNSFVKFRPPEEQAGPSEDEPHRDDAQVVAEVNSDGSASSAESRDNRSKRDFRGARLAAVPEETSGAPAAVSDASAVAATPSPPGSKKPVSRRCCSIS